MTLRRTRAVAAVLLATALIPARARGAEEGPEAPDEAHVRRGVELRGQGRNREALDEFEAAYALRPAPRTKAQIALAHQALGDWLEAERDLDEALRAPADGWIARYQTVLEQARTVIQSHLGWLVVESNVAGAELVIDGRIAGRLPTHSPVRVVAGSVDIRVRAPGYVEARRVPLIAPDRTAHETMTLQPMRPEPEKTAESPPASETARPIPVRVVRAAGIDRRTLGVLTLGGGGLFAVAAFGAWRIRAHDVSVYNDASRCLVGPFTREQNCGSYHSEADTALDVEVVSLVVSGAAVLIGEWLVATSGSSAATSRGATGRRIRLACAPWLGIGGGCGALF